MTFPLLPDYQLMLLPARNAAEASAWGAAAMAYASFYPDVHFSRDPSRVDWRGYRHVTIVNPSFWPDDLIVTIRQANPAIELDIINVESPDLLSTILNVRIFTGLRYGQPNTEPNWLELWPAGRCLIGLHGRADGELQDADHAVIQRARVEAVKLLSTATMASVERLRAWNPETFILVRAFLNFGEGRVVTPQEFFEFTVNDIARLYDADPGVRYIEIHNEPNLRLEGFGASWQDGRQFGEWFLRVRDLYRRRFPEARFGFPGLSPGPSQEAVGRFDSAVFLAQAEFAAREADWIGVHAYWVNEREITDEREGFGFVLYRRRFPDKLLFITEFGNPQQPKPVVAEQYARYYGALRRVPGLGAAFAYIVSTSNPHESSRWAWRDEAGNDVGIAEVVGRRAFIPNS
ncbi:MAG: hypothetical protein RMK99_08855 [Anaerolineales bacterium]|nr:hypothetical protein [Anaerolineales bacterium]